VLKAATDSTTTGATVYACPSSGPWASGENQDWEARPAYSCGTAPVGGTAAPDGTSMTWNLDAAMNRDGAFDVVLAGPDAGGTAFQVAFAPPDDSSLTTVGGDTGEVAPGFEAFVPSEGTGTDFSAEIPQSFDASAGAGSLSVGPSAAPAPRGPTLNSVPSGARVPLPLGDGRGDRILAGVLLAALVGGLWWVAGAPARPPRLLGTLAGDKAPAGAHVTIAGVGRFARLRAGGPKRL
jgi:hypothetical protein